MKIAGTTISRTDVMYQRGLLCPASWNTIYTLFLAVSSLLFLIATHPGTSRPSNAWKKVLFDVDQIVAATAGICPCSAAGALPHEALRRSMSKDKAGSSIHSAGYPTPDTPLESRSIQSPWSISAPGADQSQSWYIGNHDTFYRDADSILAEA